MRVLLSTIGSRGDAQPLVALASELRALGEDVRLCVPPDFIGWLGDLGIPAVPIGPELRGVTTRGSIESTVATQFITIAAAAMDCDVIVGANALQVAAPTIAEQLEIPYIHASYCPRALPSAHHAPLPLPGMPVTDTDNGTLWAADAERWNALFGPALNAHRESAGLTPVADVRGHILTDRPWLATDPTLAPWPGGGNAFQTGAWILPDDRPLAPELADFLDAGDPPVFFGFGSMRAAPELAVVMLKAAREFGRRAIISRGWADLALEGEPDCLTVGEVNLAALFGRVAAVVHHGGAGTTHAAALARVPQVVVPHLYDQPYYAQRVVDLGIGAAHPATEPTVNSLVTALDRVLRQELATIEVRTDGARVAALALSGRQ